MLLLGQIFLSNLLPVWSRAAAVPCCSTVPKHRPESPKQLTCAITTETSWAHVQQRADTAMLPWGPKWTCSAPAKELAFQRIDVVLDGLRRFFIFLASFSLFTPSTTDSSKRKILIYLHAQSFLCTWETGFLWGEKKICERVINNYITAKTGKGQIRVAEGSLIPASPGC